MKKLFALFLATIVSPQLLAQEPASSFFETSDGINIHYLTLGDEGSWVVLIHGFGDTARRMYFSTGIAQELAKNHRVVAIDNRNHGESDRPEERGAGIPRDTAELMQHLGIERAHIHGYSMGGGITGQLMDSNPELFITASFGGSGIREADPELARAAIAMDPEQNGEAPTGNVRTGPEMDLSTIDFPVLAINGELDAPYSKAQRMVRELNDFQNVVLPGKTHLTAIAVGGPMPQQYVDALARFIDSNDD